MKIKSQLAFILLIIFVIIFSGCGSKKEPTRFLLIDDVKSIFYNNKQDFINVQKAFKVNDINDNFYHFTRQNYKNQKANEEQLKALKEIFDISEVNAVMFRSYYGDENSQETVLMITYYIGKEGYKNKFEIVYNPISGDNIKKNKPEKYLEDKWFVFTPRY